MQEDDTPHHNKIVELRQKAGLTQEQVAAHLGMTYSSYSRMEKRPERIRTDRLLVLAALFGVPVGDLVGSSDAPTLGAYGRAFEVMCVTPDGLSLDRTGEVIHFTAAVSVQAYALKVTSRDMACKVKTGDIVLVDPARHPDPGDVVVAKAPLTGDIVIRFYTPLHPTDPQGAGFVLRSRNPNASPIFCPPDPNIIQGTVIQLLRTYL